MTNCSLDCASISRASATCHLTKFSHRNCKQAMVNKTIVTDNANVWGEPLLLNVLTQWGQNDFEYYSNRNENDMGKFLSLAICICDLKAPLRVTIANKSANLVKLKSKFKNYLAPLCLYTVNNSLFTN
jgi:hypothetical protein